MDKIRDINCYKDTILQNEEFFQSYYYHSLIDLNLTKLDLILKYGLLCKRLIESQNLPSIYTHQADDWDSKNGSSFISLTEYNNKCSFNEMFDSFAMHTMTSLSVMINKDVEISKVGEKETYFDDEVFCKKSIAKSALEGIILPSHLTIMPIKEINCLPTDLSCYTTRYINHWIDCMENYFERKIPRQVILESKDQLWDILEEYEAPEKWINSAIQQQRRIHGQDIKDIMAQVLQDLWQQKIGIQNPTCIDVIKKINHDKLPVYEIGPRCLKKII